MTSTLTNPASANYATMPKGKRILAALLAIVLAIGMIPFAPATKAYADTIAQSAGSKTVTRTVNFVYQGESTPFDSVQEQFTFQWGRGANLSAFSYEFPARDVTSYWTQYPSGWTFDPQTIPATTVYADTAQDLSHTVVINRNTQAHGSAVITYVDETGAEIPGTRFTVNDVYTGMPFTTTFSGGDYAGKSIIDVVNDTISKLSPTYDLDQNPFEDNANGTYTAGATYTVQMRKKDTSNIDTSVSIVFVDQYNNKIVAPDGYYAEINVGNNPATNGMRYSAINFSDGSGTLIDNVNAKKQTLINAGYQFESSEFPENGSYGPTPQTYYVHMKRPGNEEIQISGPDDVVYNGSEQKPRPTLAYNGTTLTEGVDYELYYPGTGYKLSNSDPDWTWPGGQGTDSTNAGNKEVHIVGKGLFSGFTAVQPYRILPVNITVTPSQTEFTANGQVQRPSLTATDDNGNNVPASGYTATWQNYNSTEAGTYTVTVEGKGNYTGGGEVAYVINAAPAPTKIELSNAEVTLEYETVEYDGYVHKPAVTSVKVNGTEVPASEYTVTYQDNNKCAQSGNKTVTITAKSNSATYTGDTQKGYQITKVPLSGATANVPDQTHTGSAIEPAQKTIHVTYKGNTDVTGYTIEGYSNNVNAYTYNPKPGALETAGSNPVVHVKATDGSNFTGEAYFPFNIISTAAPKTSINDNAITVSAPSDVTYNATSQKQKPVVKNGTTTLREGSDYTLSYSSETTNAGTVTVTITGIGNYKDSRTTTYQIKKAAITSVTAADQTFNQGDAPKRPTPVVKAGTLTLPASAYEVAYANNEAPGTATVTATAKTNSNFTGSESGTFQIKQAAVATTVAVNFLLEDGTPLTGMTNPARWTDYAGNQLSSSMVNYVNSVIDGLNHDYACIDGLDQWNALVEDAVQPASNTTIDLIFSERDEHTVNIKIYTGTSLRFTFGPIKGTDQRKFSDFTINDGSGRTLPQAVQDKVAQYQAEGFNGTVDWDGWDADQTGTIKADKSLYEIRLSRQSASAADFTVEVVPAQATYNGWPQQPAVRVTDKDGRVLNANSDYTLSWAPTNSTFINAGTYTVTVTGRKANGYSGTKTATYTINKARIASVELSSNSATYDGNNHKPTFTVRDADGNVVSSANYNATWTLNSSTFANEGTYELDIEAKGDNYTGSATATFTITKDPLNDMANVTVSAPADVTYNGTSQRQKPVVKKADGTTLVENTDYTLSWSADTTNAGTVTVTVTGKGAFTGSKQVSYKIKKANLSQAVLGAVSNYTYNGSERKPAPVVTYSGHTPALLSAGKDYTLKYENNVNAGTAKVWAEGNGNYEGSTAKKNFTISKASLYTMDPIANVAYDGNAKTPAVKVYNSAGQQLAEGTDYTVAYTNNTNVGTATATVTGKGNYQGTLSRTFQIYNTDTGSTTSTINVYFVYGDGSMFDRVSLNPYPVSGSANQPINSAHNTQIENLANIFAASYDVDKSAWDAIYANGSGTMPNNNQDIEIVFTKRQTYTVSVNVKFGDNQQTTFRAAGTDQTKFSDIAASDGSSWLSKIDERVNSRQGEGYTEVNWGGWDTAKNGTIDPSKLEYTILVTKPNSGTDPTPSVLSTITVKVEDDESTATYSATASAGTAISSTSLDTNVQQRITERAAVGYSVVKSDTWTPAKNGTFGTDDATYRIVLVKPGEENTPEAPTNPEQTYLIVKFVDEDGKSIGTTGTWSATTNVRLAPANGNGGIVDQVNNRIAALEAQGYTVDDRTAWDEILDGFYYPAGGTQNSPVTAIITMNSGKKSIDPAKNNRITITVEPTTVVYNGQVQKPTIKVDDGTRALITEGEDYTVLWSPSTVKNAGTYTATIKGINGYKDSTTATYTITKKSVAKPTIKSDLVYNGSEQEGVIAGNDANLFYLYNHKKTAAGTYTATARLKDKANYVWQGGGTDDLSLEFTIARKSIDVPTGQIFTFNGKTQPDSGSGVASGEGYTVSTDASYTNSYTRATSAGTYNLKVTPTSNYQWIGGSTDAKKVSWYINPAKLTSVTASDQVYDGKEKTPSLTVKSSDYNGNIYPGTGYVNNGYEIVKWKNNKNAGDAEVTVKGTGNFTDTVTGTFKINKKQVAKPSASNKTYNGDEQTGVAAKTGYTVANGTKTAAGTYTAVATLDPNYAWSDGDTKNTYSLSWTINKAKVTVPPGKTLTYNGSTQTGVAPKSGKVGYTVSGGSAKNVGNYTATVTLTDKTNTTWSNNTTANKKVSWKIMPVQEETSVRVELFDADNNRRISQTSTWFKSYTTTPITLEYGGESLKSQVDDRLAAAKADGWKVKDQSQWDAVTKTGYYPAGGDFEGASPKIITITMTKGGTSGGSGSGTTGGGTTGGTGSSTTTKTDLSKATVTLSPKEYLYNGKQQRPAVTVKVGSTTVPASNYTVNWPSNTTNVGTKSVAVTAKSTSTSYKGTSPAGTYKINPKNIASNTITSTLSPTSYTYDGKAKTPAVTVKDTATGKTLVQGTDYTIKYESNTDAGLGKVVITGKGNYTGTATKTFTIKTITSTVTVTVDSPISTYYKTASGPNNAKLSSSALVSDIQAKVDELKAKGYTQIDWDGWDKAKDGNFPTKDASYTIKMSEPGSGGGSGGTNPSSKQTTITVKVINQSGAWGKASATATVGTKVSASGLNDMVDKRVNEYKQDGFTVVEWGGWDSAKNGTFPANDKTYTIKMSRPATTGTNGETWNRLWGEKALDTMEVVGKQSNSSASYAVVVNNESYRDALAASALAGYYNAPILMSDKDGLSRQAWRELERLKASTVYIVGSNENTDPSSYTISTKVEQQIAGLSNVKKVIRVGNKSVSGRSVGAAQAMPSTSKTVIISIQTSFRDALSISTYAYASKSPIVYIERDKTMGDHVLNYIKKGGFTKALIVGGPNPIPKTIDDKLVQAGISRNNITRLAGENAYNTSRIIAEWSTGNLANGTGGGKKTSFYYHSYVNFQPDVRMSWNNIGVVQGKGWRDGISATTLCGKNRSVVVMADETNTSNVALIGKYKNQIRNGYVFGGEGAFQKGILDEIAAVSTSARLAM